MASVVGVFRQMDRELLEFENELNTSLLKARILRSCILGIPVAVVVLYVLAVLKLPDWMAAPFVVLLFLSVVVGARLLLERAGQTDIGKWRSVREVELDLAVARNQKAELAAQHVLPILVRQYGYRESIRSDLEVMRSGARYYRRVSNLLQTIIIVGSLAATAVTSLALSADFLRWVSVAITFLVGLSAGFSGFFKFKDRSFYLQQTADSIEGEVKLYELGIGRYQDLDSERALVALVGDVERLRAEQRQREQSIDQPPERGDG